MQLNNVYEHPHEKGLRYFRRGLATIINLQYNGN